MQFSLENMYGLLLNLAISNACHFWLGVARGFNIRYACHTLLGVGETRYGKHAWWAAVNIHIHIPTYIYTYAVQRSSDRFFPQSMITFLTYISNACHSLLGVAERLQHTYIHTR